MAEPTPYNNPSTGSRLKPIRTDNDLTNLVYGKIQPQAMQIEEVVLGAIMLDKEAMAIVLDILAPDSFYKKSHGVIYEAMMHLFERSQPVDILTVHEALKKAGQLEFIGGVGYLVELTNKVASAANLEFHSRIIAQKHIQRELIRVSTSTITDAFEDTKDVFQMLDEAESNLFDITQKNLNRSYSKLGDLAIKAQKELESLSKKEIGMTGVPSGFKELDKVTNGWQRSDLIIVAARPGMGKTAFTLALAKNAALDYKRPVAFFSLEMSALQLTHRLMSMVAEIPGSKLRNAQMEEYEWQQLNSAVERFSEVPIFIDDTPAINIFEMRAKCRRLKMHHDIQLVIVDYLQLMSAGPETRRGGTREQEISTISRSLKTMAKELEVPVIALSQLSRAVETRGGNKRPQLSDLRDSGAIEQDADIVTFIYRPEYYEMEADPTISKDQAEILISKHRNGALGTVNLKFISQFAKFTDPEDDYFNDISARGPAGDNYNAIITRPSRLNEDDEPVPF
jgi:replicative DNA helicase